MRSRFGYGTSMLSQVFSHDGAAYIVKFRRVDGQWLAALTDAETPSCTCFPHSLLNTSAVFRRRDKGRTYCRRKVDRECRDVARKKNVRATGAPAACSHPD